MTPLSMLKLSLGRPAMFHAWILIGSPSVLVRENPELQGIFFSYRNDSHTKTGHQNAKQNV